MKKNEGEKNQLFIYFLLESEFYSCIICKKRRYVYGIKQTILHLGNKQDRTHLNDLGNKQDRTPLT